jgi:hypothetical protein
MTFAAQIGVLGHRSGRGECRGGDEADAGIVSSR